MQTPWRSNSIWPPWGCLRIRKPQVDQKPLEHAFALSDARSCSSRACIPNAQGPLRLCFFREPRPWVENFRSRALVVLAVGFGSGSVRFRT